MEKNLQLIFSELVRFDIGGISIDNDPLIKKWIVYGFNENNERMIMAECFTAKQADYIKLSLETFKPKKLESKIHNIELPQTLKVGCSHCEKLIKFYEEIVERKNQTIKKLGLQISELHGKNSSGGIENENKN